MYNATACGYAIAATITAARAMGRDQRKASALCNERNVIGDYSQVVGYRAIVFT
jgi:AmmeMemoRadiSam system protein B